MPRREENGELSPDNKTDVLSSAVPIPRYNSGTIAAAFGVLGQVPPLRGEHDPPGAHPNPFDVRSSKPLWASKSEGEGE